MSEMYADGSYLDRTPDWHEGDSRWKADQVEELFRRNDLTPDSLADIGCGSGGVLRELAGEVWRKCTYDGYEMSRQAYDLCMEQPAPDVDYHHGELFAEPAGIRFEVAMAIDVFEHVEDYMGFLRDMRQRADYKVFHIPLDLSVQTVARSSPILEGRERVGHLHYFTKETALATLADTGYHVIDQFYTASSLDAPNLRLKPRLIRFPRRIAFKLSPDFAARFLGGWSLMVLAR